MRRLFVIQGFSAFFLMGCLLLAPNVASALPDLRLTVTDSPDPVSVGELLTYDVIVTNAGNAAATGVSLISTLASNVSYFSAEVSQGTYGQVTNTVTCNIGSIASGGVALVRILATPVVPGTFTNSISVTETQVDNNPSDNLVKQSTVIVPLTFYPGGNLLQGRQWHASTLLLNGKILVTGGVTSTGTTATAELYNPATGTSQSAGNMNIRRAGHASVLLNDGRVVIIGYTAGQTNIAEIYDPNTGVFTKSGSSINPSQQGHAVVLLQNGKVLVVGGYGTGGSYMETTELFDPTTDTFSPGPGLSRLRSWATATRLNSGNVLIAGGNYYYHTPSVDLYDPVANSIVEVSNSPPTSENWSASLMTNSNVFLTGNNRSFIYDAVSNGFSAGPNMIGSRWGHGSATMPDGKVLVCGGFNGGAQITAELYSPGTGQFTRTVDMLALRNYATYTRMLNGRMVVIGGESPTGKVASVEIYDPNRTRVPPLIKTASVTNLEDAGSLQFNVWLTTRLGVSASVNHELSSGGAESGVDFTGNSGTLVFPPGVTNLTVNVPIAAEQTFEPDEEFYLTLSNPTNALIGVSQVTGTILNDDPRPVISVQTASSQEGNLYTNVITFNLALSAASAETISLDYFTGDGTAVAGNDYYATNGTISFSPGVTNLPVRVVIRSDVIQEPDKTFYLGFTNPVNATLTTNSVAATILNDDGVAGALEHFDISPVPSPQYFRSPFSLAITAKDAFGGTITNFSGGVTLLGFVTNVPSMEFGFEEGDFSEWTPLNLGNSPGPYEIEEFDVTGRGVPSRAFRLKANLGAADGITRPVQLLAGATYRLSVDLAAMNESGNNGDASTAHLQINGVEITNFSFTVFGNIHGGEVFRTNLTANYTPPSNGVYQLSLRFDRGAFQASVWSYADNLRITGAPIKPIWIAPFTNGFWSGQISIDGLVKGLQLQVEDNEGHIGVGNVFDVEPSADLMLQSTNFPLTVRAGAAMDFTLYLTNNGPSAASNVVVTNILAGDVIIRSATNSFGSVNILGNTVIYNIGTLTNGRRVTLNATVSPHSVDWFTNSAQVTSNVMDPNPANNFVSTALLADLPLLQMFSSSVLENDAGIKTSSTPIWLEGPVSHTISMEYYTTNKTATAGLDYTAVTNTIVFLPNVVTQYLTVPILGDVIHEPSETIGLSVTNISGATPTKLHASLSIIDNDSVPVASISDVTVVEGNSGTTNAVFQVILSNPSSSQITVTCRTTNGTATSPNDFVNKVAGVVFPPGNTNQTFVVAVNGDTNNEPDQIFTVELSSSQDFVVAHGAGTGTILNDDAVPGRLFRFAFDPIPHFQMTNNPFTVTIRALDHLDQPADFTGPVTLKAQTDGYYVQELWDDFEDGDAAGWTNMASTSMQFFNVSNTAAAGSRSLMLSGRASSANYFSALRRVFTNSRPNKVSFHVRAGQTNAITGRMWVGSLGGYRTFDFQMNKDGRMGLSSFQGFSGVPYESGRWYKVDLDLDWTTRKVNCRIDGSLAVTNVSFIDDPYPGSDVIAIQNSETGLSWFDQIHVYNSYFTNLSVTPSNITGFVNGVWSGNLVFTEKATNVYVIAADAADHSGTSGLFHVLTAPVNALQHSRLGDGRFQLVLQGPMGENYTLYASTNLISWTSILNFTFTNSTITVTDPDSTNINRRYYKITPVGP